MTSRVMLIPSVDEWGFFRVADVACLGAPGMKSVATWWFDSEGQLSSFQDGPAPFFIGLERGIKGVR